MAIARNGIPQRFPPWWFRRSHLYTSASGTPKESWYRVCHLKSLYDLKQASRNWFTKLWHALLSTGFTQSKVDCSLFTLTSSLGTVHLLVYVDDIIIIGDNPSLIRWVKSILHTKFHTKDLGKLRYFLGLELTYLPIGIHINQKYILDLLSKYGLLGSKPSKIPMDRNIDFRSPQHEVPSDPTIYWTLVGKLIYLTFSRADITYPINTNICSNLLKSN